MGGLQISTALAIFGIGTAVFFALIGFLIRKQNSGVFRFFFISFGLISILTTASSMGYLALKTAGTTEDISGIADTYFYTVYALGAVLLIWIAYFVIGMLVAGVNFATSFLEDSGFGIKKAPKRNAMDNDLPDYK